LKRLHRHAVGRDSFHVVVLVDLACYLAAAALFAGLAPVSFPAARCRTFWHL
jgi:hypothetical protein